MKQWMQFSYRIPFLFIFIFLAAFGNNGWGQPSGGVSSNSDTLHLTLSELIEMATNQSPSSLEAETIKENKYWQWKTHRSNFYPQLGLEGNFPDFTREFREVTQEDGNIEFRKVFNNNSTLDLSLTQWIEPTGGQIFMSSQISRFDNFESDLTRFSGNPLIIGLRQPLFSYNWLKWDDKIKPLRYEESKRDYHEDMEQVAIDATDRFFDLLIAQTNLEIARKNLQNNDTIYKIGQGRFDLGQIAEYELLQLELVLTKSQQAVAEAKLDKETASLKLKSYVGIDEDANIELKVPSEIPEVDVTPQEALNKAQENVQDPVTFKRRELEAEREVAEAEGNNGFNADLFATYGLTNRAENLGTVYGEPDNQQSLRIGFSIPILDWGRTASRIKTAEANQKLVNYQVKQDRINFKQEIYTQVKRLKMLANQVETSKKADKIGEKRYEFARKRYLIGKISITDLTIARQDKDNASRSYINALEDFWEAYYRLRKLTLYDFIKEKNIKYESEDFEKNNGLFK